MDNASEDWTLLYTLYGKRAVSYVAIHADGVLTVRLYYRSPPDD